MANTRACNCRACLDAGGKMAVRCHEEMPAAEHDVFCPECGKPACARANDHRNPCKEQGGRAARGGKAAARKTASAA